MKKKIIIVAIILTLIVIPLIISANNGDKVKKLYDREFGSYGKITLKNESNGLGNLITYTLDDYTTHCLTKCEATGTVIINKKHKLFNKINFKDRANNLNSMDHTLYLQVSEDIVRTRTIYEPVCSVVKNGSLCIDNKIRVEDFSHTIYSWEEYNNKPLSPGTYKWKLVVNKKFNKDIDWIPNVLGIDLIEWAWFNSDFRFKRSHNINNTGSTTLINFPYLVNGSAGFDIGANPDETQYVWSTVNTLTTSNQTQYLYYTNNSYYAISNGSENVQQNMDVDFGNETNVNARNLWIDAGAVLVYHMNSFAGQFVEASGRLNGSYSNGSTIVEGVIAKGSQFDGIDQSVDIDEVATPGHLDIGKNFTISFWANRTMDDTQQAIMSASQTSCGDNYIFFNASNNLRIAVQGNYINNFSATLLNNTWYHIALTSLEGNKSLYINGKWNASDTNNGGALNLTCMIEEAGNSLSFGAEETGAQPFGGVLDEFRFYNETKSGDWIFQEYSLGSNILEEQDEFVGNITLITPTNDSTFGTSNVSFNCTVVASDQVVGLSNLSLIIDQNINFTNSTAGANISLNLDVLQLKHGTHNWTCRGVDPSGNEKDAATFSFTLNDTAVPNATINTPSGSTTTITPTINITTEDNFAVSSCFYNITTQANTGVEVVSLRQISNCQNDSVPDAALSDGTSYYMFLLVNDSQGNTNITNSTFTIDLPAGPGGGGGGGGGSVTIIGGSGEALWTLETDLGRGRYDIDLVGGIRVVKGLKFENVGSESRDISLTCEDINGDLCQYVEFEETSFNLPLILDFKLRKTYSVKLPNDFPDGEYTFNVVATDDLGLQGVVSNTVTVGPFGNIRVIFIKLGASKDIFGFNIHYTIILLALITLIPILSFKFINIPFFDGRGVAINIIAGLILGFFSLIFI